MVVTTSETNKPMPKHPEDHTSTFDQEKATALIGKHILVGITYCNHLGTETDRQQLHGIIKSADPDGILIDLKGVHEGSSWNMPPDLLDP